MGAIPGFCPRPASGFCISYRLFNLLLGVARPAHQPHSLHEHLSTLVNMACSVVPATCEHSPKGDTAVIASRAVDKCLHPRHVTKMAHFLISYDLRQPGRNYSSVYTLLGAWGAQRLLQSLWLLASPLSSLQIRDSLRQHIDVNDGVAVFELKPGSNWATAAVEPAGSRWLQLNIP